MHNKKDMKTNFQLINLLNNFYGIVLAYFPFLRKKDILGDSVSTF